MKSHFTFSGLAVILISSVLVNNVAWADSSRFQWNGNKHFYKRYDTALTWVSAEASCISNGAKLVTITSAAEQGFVDSALWPGETLSSYWIGGSNVTSPKNYTWVTGEPWSYTDYRSSLDASAQSANLSISLGSGGYWDSDTHPKSTNGYICEWNSNNYIGVADVPDMNQNGYSEIAVLYVNYVNFIHTVVIRDSKTDAVLSTLTFQTNANPPSGIVVLNDLNGNHIPEIGVLSTAYGQPALGIKDAMHNAAYLKTLYFLDTTFNPVHVTVSPVKDNGGYSEITVLGMGISDNMPKSETQDSSTGAILNDNKF